MRFSKVILWWCSAAFVTQASSTESTTMQQQIEETDSRTATTEGSSIVSSNWCQLHCSVQETALRVNFTEISKNTSQVNLANLSDFSTEEPDLCRNCDLKTHTPVQTTTAKTLLFQKITKQIWRYCPPILFTIGTVGNILCAIIMLRKSVRSSNTSLFLVVTAVIDTLMLWTGLTNQFTTKYYNLSFRDYSTFLCKAHVFLVYWLRQYGSWVLAAMNLERFFAIMAPFQSKQYVSKKRCALLIGFVGICLAGLNVHEIVFFYVKVQDPYFWCTASEESFSFYVHTWPWVDISFQTLIPFALITFGNFGIIAQLVHSNYLRKRNMNAEGVKMNSMTAVLLLVSLAFLFSSAPLAVYLIIRGFVFMPPFSPEKLALRDLLWAAAVNIAYINYSCNFFMYCASGPRFRAEIRALFGFQTEPRTEITPVSSRGQMSATAPKPEESVQ